MNSTALDVSGIYKISNVVNGKFYIGSAVNVRVRWNCHLTYLRKGKHHSRHLQNSFNKYGKDIFTIEVIELVAKTKKELLEREQFYLDTLKPFHNTGYNVSPTAGSNLGVKHSKATREKTRQRMIGNIPWNKGKQRPPFSEEWKRKLARPAGTNPFFGKKHSDETRSRIAEKARERLKDPTRNYFYGKHFSGPKNGMYGHTHTPEARARIGAPHRGKTLSPEHIESLRRATSLRAAKAVEQITLDGEVLARYRTLGDAASAVGTSGSYLCTKLHKGNSILKGYRWRYALEK